MKKPYFYTTQKQVRAAFWECHPDADKRKIAYGRDVKTGKIEKIYKTDTRVTFVDFVDYLARAGMISAELASRVTL